MVTIQNLYNNIKEFIHQKFEYKEEEDTTLPQTVESFFKYSWGELDINNNTQTVNVGQNDGDGEEIEGATISDPNDKGDEESEGIKIETDNMFLYEDLVTLIHKYFYKTEEKPETYYEWLISEYKNGIWYIGEKAKPFFGIRNNMLITNTDINNWKIENKHLYTKDSGNYKIENNHLYKEVNND